MENEVMIWVLFSQIMERKQEKGKNLRLLWSVSVCVCFFCQSNNSLGRGGGAWLKTSSCVCLF